jgi:DNA-directed RNA polymerase subunit RPC12/RpoP
MIVKGADIFYVSACQMHWRLVCFYMMETYKCLRCFHEWQGRVAEYKDWGRRKCGRCGSRQTVIKSLYDRAVDAIADSLKSSPPPYPPLPSSVLFSLDVINETLPDLAAAVKVAWRMYQEAKDRLESKGQQI